MTTERLVMRADHNWRRGAFWPSMLALMFGRRERVVYNRQICTIAWWDHVPYLISSRWVRS